MKLEEIKKETELEGGRLIYLSYGGSILHGTNHENSDLDMIGIFIPNIKDIVLKRDKKYIDLSTSDKEVKNDKNDIDIKIVSIYEFFSKLKINNLTALELLFSMNSKSVIYETEISKKIFKNKELFLTSNLDSIIGNVTKNVKKLENKNERYKSLRKFLDFIEEKTKDFSPIDFKKKSISELEGIENYHYDKNIYISNDQLIIIDKKYGLNNRSGFLIKGVEKILSKYRIKTEDIDYSDYKILVHTYSSLLLSEELYKTGEIKYPLKDRDLLKDIKFGKFTPTEINEKISSMISTIQKMKKEEQSVLPDKNLDQKEKIDSLLFDLVVF